MQERERQSGSKLDVFILLFTFILANLRALIFIFLYPDTSVLLGPAWIEIALWVLITMVVAYQLRRGNQIAHYLAMWRRNWLLVAFLLLAFASVLWSLSFVTTLFRVLELFLATLIAAYLGTSYRPHQMLTFLFWFGAILVILTVATVFAAPRTGTMYWAPFNGAWRGIYWHRNHLASIAALINVVFLCRGLSTLQKGNLVGLLDGLFHFLSLAILYFTKSAAGYILFIILNSVAFCCWLWLRFADRLHRQHYYVIFGVFVAGSILILSNLDIVFGLFNRSTTLTGRVGLWDYLLRNMVSRRPWIGHGFGAVWTLDSFREQVRQHVGWPSQPLIADNGFLDILLHVGVVGLLVFLAILIIAFIRSFRYAVFQRTLEDFFPLIVMIYAVFANISFSLFAETEVFVWSLIVIVLFMTMSSPANTA